MSPPRPSVGAKSCGAGISGSSKPSALGATASARFAAAPVLEHFEHGVDERDLPAGGRRGAADEVEDLSVLQAIVGEPLDPALAVEIDRDHALVDHVLVQEIGAALGALGDVVERLAAYGRNRRGRAEHDQHLFLARSDRQLLERALWHDIAALIGLAEAPAHEQA